MRRLILAIGLTACVLVPSALFLGRYVVSGTGVAPAGSDTSQHVWRSEVVAGLGLEALPAFEGRSQALNTNADRPGLPIVLSFLSAFTGAEARELAYVFPSVAAAAIALAAAALAGAIPGVPGWGIGVVGVATGASVHVALAANGYLDQLLVEPLLLLAAVCALSAAAGGPGRALGAAALLAAWLTHWQFALLFTVLLGVLALGIPAGVAPRPPPGTPTGRDPLRSRGDDDRGRRRPRDRRAPPGNAGDPARTHRALAQLGGPAPLGPARSLSAAGGGDRRGRGRCLAWLRHVTASGRLAPPPVGAGAGGRGAPVCRRSHGAAAASPFVRAGDPRAGSDRPRRRDPLDARQVREGGRGRRRAPGCRCVDPFGLVRMGNVADEEAVERGPRARRVPGVGQLPGRSRPPRDRRGGRGTEGGERHGRRVRDRAGDAADPGRSAGPSRAADDRLPRRPRPPPGRASHPPSRGSRFRRGLPRNLARGRFPAAGGSDGRDPPIPSQRLREGREGPPRVDDERLDGGRLGSTPAERDPDGSRAAARRRPSRGGGRRRSRRSRWWARAGPTASVAGPSASGWHWRRRPDSPRSSSWGSSWSDSG